MQMPPNIEGAVETQRSSGEKEGDHLKLAWEARLKLISLDEMKVRGCRHSCAAADTRAWLQTLTSAVASFGRQRRARFRTCLLPCAVRAGDWRQDPGLSFCLEGFFPFFD